ncbi:MAG: adenylyl-sulfate kinase [Bacillota bacterium]
MGKDTKQPSVITPYGGKLVNLVVDDNKRDRLLEKAKQIPSLQLSLQSISDIELLATGALSPLDRFMGGNDYIRVLDEMRLTNGMLFPVPIVLATENNVFDIGDEITLRNDKNEIVGVMKIEEKFERDPVYEVSRVFGITDTYHPLVADATSWGQFCLSGPLAILNLVHHYNFKEFRYSPLEIRKWLNRQGYSNAVAFETSGFISRIEEELTRKMIEKVGGALIIQAVFDPSQREDLDAYIRNRTYEALMEKYYDRRRTILNLVPLGRKTISVQNILWRAIIHRNYGAYYFVLGPEFHTLTADLDPKDEASFGTHKARELLKDLSPEIGVKIMGFNEMCCLLGEDQSKDLRRIYHMFSTPAGRFKSDHYSEATVLPKRLLHPEVAAILSEAYPPRHRQGFCIWLTGLPCAGKSTIAEIVTEMLHEYGKRVTLLDGDVVRTHLSKGLGFAKQDRDTNVLRIGFVASEIVRHNGTVVCAAVSPYRATRNQVRNMVGEDRFIEVFVNTPIEVCEQRDSKGLYAKARLGQIKRLTGIDDPYEASVAPEMILTTTDCSPEDNALKVINFLVEKGFLLPKSKSAKKELLDYSAYK